MKTVTKYICEVCDTAYDDAVSAAECEARREAPLVSVGDIVTVRSGYSWYDGDPRWIANYAQHGGPPGGPEFMLAKRDKAHGNCFGPCCTYQFLYVVTAVTHDPRDRHKLRYHVASKACAQERLGCWTSAGHHVPVKSTDHSAFVVWDSRDLIGRVNEALL